MRSVYTNGNTHVFHVRLPTCVRMLGNNSVRIRQYIVKVEQRLVKDQGTKQRVMDTENLKIQGTKRSKLKSWVNIILDEIN